MSLKEITMSAPVKLNFKMYQGSTFREVFRWESITKVYVPITNISNTAPVVITTETNHNIPAGWRARVTGAGGIKELNSSDDQYYLVTDVTDNTVILNEINATKYGTYTTGGTLEYNKPVNLLGYSARMQLRPKINSEEILDTYTTENGRLVIDVEDNTISIEVPATITESYNFNTAVYSLELLLGVEVVPFINGTITLVKEVTR